MRKGGFPQKALAILRGKQIECLTQHSLNRAAVAITFAPSLAAPSSSFGLGISCCSDVWESLPLQLLVMYNSLIVANSAALSQGSRISFQYVLISWRHSKYSIKYTKGIQKYFFYGSYYQNLSDVSEFVRYVWFFQIMSDVSDFARLCQICQILSDYVR